MITTKVEPEEMIKGKKYCFEAKVGDFKGYGVFSQLFNHATVIRFQHGGFITILDFLERYNFYSVSSEFYIKWNQQYSSATNPYVIMGFKSKSQVAEVNLDNGNTFGSRGGPRFSDIPDQPETIKIDGKTYNHSEVIERLKQLKTVKE